MKKSNVTIESLLEIIEAQATQIKQLEARIHELEALRDGHAKRKMSWLIH